MRFLHGIILLLLIDSCETREDILFQNFLLRYGKPYFNKVSISFEFREKKYALHLNNGTYRYYKIDKDTTDILENTGFHRWVAERKIALSENDSNSLANQLNSVIYFSLLPLRLDDPAVIKKFHPVVDLHHGKYLPVEIRFRKEGGGSDFNDVFIYWFNLESHYFDFMAYQFGENGGSRFRIVSQRHFHDPFVFQDYNNYSADSVIELLDYPYLYFSQNLIKVSEINIENIEIKR